MKILVAGDGKGKGMAADNKTKAVTYTKRVEVQAGLGWASRSSTSCGFSRHWEP